MVFLVLLNDAYLVFIGYEYCTEEKSEDVE
jgi:hypothetical protein